MEAFNVGNILREIKPLYHTFCKLMYNGKLVGYRVRSSNLGLVEKKYEYYDLDLELIEILNQDLKGYAVQMLPNVKNSVNLIPKGKLLVPETDIAPNRDLDTCDYNTFMQSRHSINTPLDKTMEELEKCDYELKALYNKYNDMIFGGKLPYDVPVYYDTKLKATAGKCNYKWKKVVANQSKRDRVYSNFYIRLSRDYVDRFGDQDDFRNTLIHEMIHVLHPYAGHRNEFMYEMNRINREFGQSLGVNITIYSLGAGNYNYKYACANCDNSYEQMRKSKNINAYHCGKCKGKLYLKEDKKEGVIYNSNGIVIGTIDD